MHLGKCMACQRSHVFNTHISLRFQLSHGQLRNARHVAVKALKGMSTNLHFQGYIQELPIMERVTHLIRRSGQPVYCTTLLSHFIHPGKPNDGQHLCLVMDVFAGDVETLRTELRALPPQLVKHILRDCLRGLAQLHASGCVHTGRFSLLHVEECLT